MTLEEGQKQLREHLDPMWTAYNGWCLHKSFETGGQWLWLAPDDPTVIWMHTELDGAEDTSMYLSDAPFIKRDGWELTNEPRIQEWVDEAYRRANTDTDDE